MVQLDAVIALVSYIGVVSVASERTVEMMKPFITTHISDKYAKVAYYALAALAGGVLHMLSSQSIPHFENPVSAAIVVGLLASGGSGVWHDLLGIIQKFRSGVPATM